MKIQKFEYLKNEKSFLDEINIFHKFKGLSYGEKINLDKKQQTQALKKQSYLLKITDGPCSG